MTVASATSFDASCHLTCQEIKFTASGAFLRIQWTKTLQHKEGLLIIPLPSIPGSTLCPATALLHFSSLVPTSPSALLFCLPPPLAIALSPSLPSALASNASFQLSALSQPTTLFTAFVAVVLRLTSSAAFQSTSKQSSTATGDQTPSMYTWLSHWRPAPTGRRHHGRRLIILHNVTEQCEQRITFYVLSAHQPFTQNFKLLDFSFSPLNFSFNFSYIFYHIWAILGI